MERTKLMWAVLLLTSLSSCHQPGGGIDEVAALYSNRQIIPNIEYSRIDSTSLYLRKKENQPCSIFMAADGQRLRQETRQLRSGGNDRHLPPGLEIPG